MPRHVVRCGFRSPPDYEERGSFTIPDVNSSWPHLTVADGKLYVREHDALYGYDMGKAKAAVASAS